MRPARPSPVPRGAVEGRTGPVARGLVAGAAPALVVLLALATGVAELAAATGWRLLASPAASRVVLAVLVGAVLVGGWWVHRTSPARPAGGRGPARASRGSWWLVSAPGLLMLGYAVVALAVPRATRAAWFLGGDHLRHLTFTAQEVVTGNLDYTVNPYPRAWHTLVALAWTAFGGRQDARGLLGLVDLLSLASWCAYALLALATGHAAHALAARRGLSERAAAGAGLVAGAITLWPSFLSDYMVLGFENSVLAGVVLAVSARQVLARPRPWRVVVCAAGIAVMANAWQVLLPATVLAFAVVAVGGWRRGGGGTRATVLAALAVSVAIAVPGLRGVGTIGIGHATDAGVEAPLPVVFLPLAFAATLWVGWRARRDLSALAFVLMAVGTALTAAVLAVRVGIPITQYYPAKVLWNAVVLGLAPLGVVTSVAVGAVWRVRGALAVPARALAGTVAILLLVACAVNPAFAVVSWPNVDGGRVLATVTAPAAGQAQVVWLPGHPNDSTVARILLDFYRVGSAPWLPQEPLPLERECELLGGEQRPAVLSSAPAGEVRSRYACVPGVQVITARVS